MKSVVAAVILLMLTVVFTFGSTQHTSDRLQTLSEMTEALPTQVQAFAAEQEALTAHVREIGDAWAADVRYFSYVCGYTALNRADEAVWDLYAAMLSGSFSDAIRARMQLLDALGRLRALERVSLSSVF